MRSEVTDFRRYPPSNPSTFNTTVLHPSPGFIHKRTNYHLTDGAIPVLQTSYHPATVSTVLAGVQLHLGKGNSQFAEKDPLLSESYSTTSDTAFTGVNNCQQILIRLLPFPRTLVSDEVFICFKMQLKGCSRTLAKSH